MAGNGDEEKQATPSPGKVAAAVTIVYRENGTHELNFQGSFANVIYALEVAKVHVLERATSKPADAQSRLLTASPMLDPRRMRQ